MMELCIEQSAEVLWRVRLRRYARMVELQVVNDSAMEAVQGRGVPDAGQPHDPTIWRFGRWVERFPVTRLEDLAVTKFRYESQPLLVQHAPWPWQPVKRVD